MQVHYREFRLKSRAQSSVYCTVGVLLCLCVGLCTYCTLYSTVCSRRFSLASIRVHCRVGAPNNYPVCCLHRDFLRQWHVAVDMVDCHDPTTHLVVSINIQKNKTLWLVLSLEFFCFVILEIFMKN